MASTAREHRASSSESCLAVHGEDAERAFSQAL